MLQSFLVPNYSKMKSAEDTLVPLLLGKREVMFVFSVLFVHAAARGETKCLRCDVENCQHADQKQLTRR